MLTREQILKIQSYCAEHGVSQKDRLEELKAKYYETDASKAVYYPGGVFRAPKDSDCGVLILEPGKNPVFMEYLEFLGSVGWTGE